MGAAVLAIAGWMAASAALPGTWSDEAVTRSIAAAIQSCPDLTIFDHVTGRAAGGVVTLDGRVTSERKRAGIEQRIRAMDGVRMVRNDVSVLPPSRRDDELRHRVARAIYGHPAFWSYAAMSSPPIHIVVERGTVTLAGVVESEVERAMAGALAGGHGERPVVNGLIAEPGSRRRVGRTP